MHDHLISYSALFFVAQEASVKLISSVTGTERKREGTMQETKCSEGLPSCKVRRHVHSSRSGRILIVFTLATPCERTVHAWALPTSILYACNVQDGSTGMLRDPFQSPLESMARRPQVRRGPVKKVAEDVQHFPTQNTCLLAHLKDLADQFLSSGYNSRFLWSLPGPLPLVEASGVRVLQQF